MKRITLIVLTILIGQIMTAQDGTLDTSFGNQGIIYESFEEGNNNVVNAIEISEGKIMVAILMVPNGAEQYQTVLRFLESGDLDQNFGNAGVFTIADNEGYLRSISKLANDSFIANYNGADQNYIVKYLSDTSIDLSFGNDGGLEPMGSNQTFRSVKTNADDTFLAYGEEVIDGIVHLIIKKFSPDGSIDVTFGTDGVKKYPITNDESINYFTFKITANQKVLVTYKDFNGSPQSYIHRFLENGVPDATFGNNGVVNIPIEEEYQCDCFEFNDESVLIGCSYYDIDLETVIKKSLKLKPNGNLDQNFANAGYLDGIRAVFIQQNQQFIGENHYSDFEGGTLLNYKKYYSGGSQNTDFGAMSSPFRVDSPKLLLLNSGKFLIATNEIWYQANPYTHTILLRYNNNPLGIEENPLQNLNIYPNPSNGVFTIASEAFIEPTPFQITDVSGKIIQQGILFQAENQVDISNEANGIYILKVSGASYKLIKQ